MTDEINVKMTLTEAHYLSSTLNILSIEEPNQAKILLRIREKVNAAIRSLDYSENESHVDKINDSYARQA